MDLLDQLSEEFLQRCLEDLDSLWLMNAKPGDDNDNEDPEVCPNCGAEQCRITTIMEAIRDDVCTGRFDIHCAACGLSGVLYGRLYDQGLNPKGQPRGELSQSPYRLP
jgi:hypothetical protein